MPVKYRLKKRKQFNYIYKHGKRAGGAFVNIVYCNAGARVANPKFGFSANKKVGNSVVRHRATRLMREAVKPFIDKVDQRNNYIVIAKEGIEKEHLLYITLDIEKSLKKVGLL